MNFMAANSMNLMNMKRLRGGCHMKAMRNQESDTDDLKIICQVICEVNRVVLVPLSSHNTVSKPFKDANTSSSI